MKEVFQNYQHYTEWLNKNWKVSKEMDSKIIQSGLVHLKVANCNGEEFRSMTKQEFNEFENESGFIIIPV